MIDQDSQDLYDEVGTAFADVHLEHGAEDAIKRGRTLRRRRRTVPALAAAGVLAFSLSLAAVTQTHTPSNGAVVNVDEAAFSVHTDTKTGVVTVTIRELFDQNQLRQLLAKAGIPAVFGQVKASESAKAKSPCMWTGASNLDPNNVLVMRETSNGNAFEIHRSAMPPGSVLGFAYLAPVSPRGKASFGVSAELLSNKPTGLCLTSLVPPPGTAPNATH